MYTPPAPCESIVFDLTHGYAVPLECEELVFFSSEEVLLILTNHAFLTLYANDSLVSGGQDFNLPVNVSPGNIKLGWKKAENIIEQHLNFPHDNAIVTEKQYRSNFVDAAIRDIKVSPSFDVMFKADNTAVDTFSDFTNKPDLRVGEFYVSKMHYSDLSTDIPWGEFFTSDLWVKLPYRFPFPNDLKRKISWDLSTKVNINFSNPYTGFIFQDVHHSVYWGPYWYSLWCEQQYYPPEGCRGIPFKIHESPPFGVCQNIEMYIGPQPNVRCPWMHKHSGVRDRYIVFPTPPPSALTSWMFYMMNTISIKRIPDNTYIDCYSVDIQTDIDSWTWDFSIVLPDQAYLNLVKPQLAGGEVVLMDLEVMVNGWKWICKIESWQESRSFGKRSWTVRGRSSSVELAAPYALPGVFVNTEARQGSQLIDEILQYTGWSVHWGFENNVTTYSEAFNPTTDWLVPANVFTINEKTRIQAIQHVTEAIGAKIITNPYCIGTDKNFIIIPRYRHTPWNWETQTVDHMIHENACWEMGRSYENKPKVNAVIVSGENDGAVISATVNGTAGNKVAPMVTHPLITSQGSGHEKAKSILSYSGMWTQHTLKLFSLDDFLDPQGTFPGLLLPGKLIQITEGMSNWRGQVTSVHIHGESISGNNGIQVTQTIGVEEYHG